MPSRYREVMLELVDAVVGGEYREAAWLPPPADLQLRFGCSRGTLREALRAGEERGLLEVLNGRGHRVHQRERWDLLDADVLRAAIAKGPDPALVAQLVDARAALEREAALRVLEQATDADLGLLADVIEALAETAAASTAVHETAAIRPAGAAVRGAADDDAFAAAEAWFHQTLALLSGNPLLAKLGEPLHPRLAQLRRQRAPSRDGAVIRHHRRILEGLSSREPPLALAAVDGYARQLARWLGTAAR